MAIYFKACVRCNGDLFDTSNAYGPYIQCLQCSRTYDIGKDGKPHFFELLFIKPTDQSEALTLDEHIEILGILDGSQKLKLVNDVTSQTKKSRELTIEHLLKMENHGYVSTTKISDDGTASYKAFEITQKGREVNKSYNSLVSAVKKEGNLCYVGVSVEQVKTYKLLDVDGELTPFGKYATEISKALSDFIDDIRQTTEDDSELSEELLI